VNSPLWKDIFLICMKGQTSCFSYFLGPYCERQPKMIMPLDTNLSLCCTLGVFITLGTYHVDFFTFFSWKCFYIPLAHCTWNWAQYWTASWLWYRSWWYWKFYFEYRAVARPPGIEAWWMSRNWEYYELQQRKESQMVNLQQNKFQKSLWSYCKWRI